MTLSTERAQQDESDIERRFWTTAACLAAQSPDAGWPLYSRLKALYANAHLDASPEDYDAAMARISRLAGV